MENVNNTATNKSEFMQYIEKISNELDLKTEDKKKAYILIAAEERLDDKLSIAMSLSGEKILLVPALADFMSNIDGLELLFQAAILSENDKFKELITDISKN